MNQQTTPLFDALMEHHKKKTISFHVPGHKNGAVFAPKGNPFFHHLLQIDATELAGLDDLHSPEAAILAAQELLAELYKVKQSFFLVNGSTSGNLTMVMSACEEDDFVLVQRNCHKSIMNALRLAKVRPVFLEPEYDPQTKVAGGIAYETFAEAIKQYPEAKAVVLTYPNYYGEVYPLQDIIELAHQSGISVLIDEAHGAHFVIGDPFPPSAVQLGADMVVQSAHKTLPAMTMGSYLHFNSSSIKLEKVLDYLQVFQSSSPSYPIMASLDLARSYIGNYHSEDGEFLLSKINTFKQELAAVTGLHVLDSADPLKLIIRSATGASGFGLQQCLEEEGVFAELADPDNVLFVLPLVKKDQEFPWEAAIEKIKRAVAKVKPEKTMAQKVDRANTRISRLAITYQDMDKHLRMETAIESARGKAAAETIIPYPPGIPLLLKGEEITSEKIELLQHYRKAGARFQGGDLLNVGRIRVFV